MDELKKKKKKVLNKLPKNNFNINNPYVDLLSRHIILMFYNKNSVYLSLI